ncbi:hypothetical protein EV715DRAFT_204320 [Schizophyllum commune]
MQNSSDYQSTSNEPEVLELSADELELLLDILGPDLALGLLEIPSSSPEVTSSGHVLTPEEWDACYSAIMLATAADASEGPSAANPNSESEATTPSSEALTPSPEGPPMLPPRVVSTTLRQKAAAARRKDTKASVIPCPLTGCTSTFTRQGNLKVHLMSHENKLKFVCDVPSCGKRFNHRGLLRSHCANAHKEKASGLES